MAILTEKRIHPDLSQGDARVDISAYDPDVRLATLIGKPALQKYKFTPLDLYPNSIVLAVSETQFIDEIRQAVAGAIGSAAPEFATRRHSVIVLWATEEAITRKLAVVFP